MAAAVPWGPGSRWFPKLRGHTLDPTSQPELGGSPVPGILQGRVLEWDAIAFSIAKSQTRLKSLSTHANGFKIVPLKSFMKT